MINESDTHIDHIVLTHDLPTPANIQLTPRMMASW